MPGAATVLSRVFDRKRFLWKERGPVQEAAAAALARLPKDVSRGALESLVGDRNSRIASIAATAISGEREGPARP